MKKLICIFLMLAVFLTLCACGGEKAPANSDAAEQPPEVTDAPEAPAMSKDEMMAQATEFSMIDINNDTLSNIAKAKQLYCDKLMLLTGEAITIEADHIELGTYNCRMKVYLPLEELVKLESNQYVTIVGKTSPEIESTSDAEGFPIDYYTMDTAYFVKDYYEISGKLFGENQSYAPAWNILVPPTSIAAQLVHFNEEVDTSALDPDAELTISAKIIGGSYYDATIVSIAE